MEIKTKYNINDYVYFIHENKIIHNKIKRIDITIYEWNDKNPPTIDYTIDLGFNSCRISKTLTRRLEHELYSTKKELIKSIDN